MSSQGLQTISLKIKAHRKPCCELSVDAEWRRSQEHLSGLPVVPLPPLEKKERNLTGCRLDVVFLFAVSEAAEKFMK